MVTEPLFEHLPGIAHQIRANPKFLLCLDFDGTLAPIVPNPADAQIPGEGRAVLEALASQSGVILAVISGRGLADLQSRTELKAILAGNHGLEIAGDGIAFCQPQAAEWQAALHEMCSELESRVSAIGGILVEDKGLTASVHYRNAAPPDLPRLSEIIRAVVTPNTDRFLVRRGKKVFEILPRVPWDKSAAALWILQKLRETGRGDVSVCYIGDDSTDEFAFRALKEAITIRVGTGSSTAARFYVQNTGNVYEFLRWVTTARLEKSVSEEPLKQAGDFLIVDSHPPGLLLQSSELQDSE